MIVALGVDYSIFLMMLYRELDGNATEMILDGVRHIGGVVISATVILGLFLIKICYVTNFLYQHC